MGYERLLLFIPTFPIYFNAILPRTLSIIANMQTIYRLIHREEFMHPFSLEALLQNTVLLQFREIHSDSRIFIATRFGSMFCVGNKQTKLFLKCEQFFLMNYQNVY